METRLVYIVAWGRSGSTILGNIIGALPGVFDAGELRHFWARAGRGDHFCGCGASLEQCDFWRRVSDALHADADMPTDDFTTIRRWQREATRTRRTRQVIRINSADELPPEPFAPYIAALRCLHRAIAQTSEAKVVIDSSKKTGYGALLRLASETQLLCVHLVRDPRAVAFSAQRVKPAGPPAVSSDRQMPRQGAVASSVNWVACNLGADMLRRRNPGALFVRYEDMVSSPRTTVARITNSLGLQLLGPPFTDEHTVELPPNHAFAGNPSRFHHGRVSLSLDDEWRRAQRRIDRITCEVITLPFLRRYGYSLRSHPAGQVRPRPSSLPS